MKKVRARARLQGPSTRGVLAPSEAPSDEALGRTPRELIIPETDQEQVDQVMDKLVHHQGGIYNINRNRTKAGRRRW